MIFGNRRLRRMARRTRDALNRQYAIAAGFYPREYRAKAFPTDRIYRSPFTNEIRQGVDSGAGNVRVFDRYAFGGPQLLPVRMLSEYRRSALRATMLWD